MRNTGNGIRRTRCKLGITQETLSKKVGVGRSLISKIETGESDGSLQTLKKIATALGVTINDLLDDKIPKEHGDQRKLDKKLVG